MRCVNLTFQIKVTMHGLNFLLQEGIGNSNDPQKNKSLGLS